MQDLNDIIKRAIEISPDAYYLVESELFATLYAMEDKPDYAPAYLGISSWMGTSLRSGVWTYYESTSQREIDTVIRYLNQYAPDSEIAKMYALGNHEYSDEKYQADFDYPQEWIDESEIIDDWISENEVDIIRFLQDLLRKENTMR